MKDKISIKRLELLHPKVKETFKSFIEECEDTLNITLRISQGLRTIEEQNALYAQGRTKPGKIVTNAKGGSSYHNYGLAIDLVRMDGKDVDWNFDMKKLLPIANKYNIEWGGNWKTIKDFPHWQITFGYSIKSLLTKYNNKDFLKYPYLNI